MSTVQVFERNAFYVEWSKTTAFQPCGIYLLIGPDGYRRSYGTDQARAIAACKRKGGAEKPAFKESFRGNVYHDATITTEFQGFTITATIHADSDHGAPWENEDGHGPVSNWTNRSKNAGELVLCADRGSKRYYDFAEACKIAFRDQWGIHNDTGMTAREVAAEAARQDYERLRAWCNGEWVYVGVALQVSKADIDLTGPYGAALWGMESDWPSHITDTANELLPEAIQVARATLAKLRGKNQQNIDPSTGGENARH